MLNNIKLQISKLAMQPSEIIKYVKKYENKNNNIIIFVHTCTKYEECRAKIIEKTWGNRENVVFITDNPNSTLKNFIYLGPYSKGALTYQPNTVVKMFNLFIEKYSNDYDWFMIIDDDSYLYVDRLKDYLKFYDPKDNLMIGTFLWRKCFYNDWVHGGPGIVFSLKCIINYLYIIRNVIVQLSNHDVWLHDLWKSTLNTQYNTIKLIHCPGFYHTFESSKNKSLVISIHVEKKHLDKLYYFHNLK